MGLGFLLMLFGLLGVLWSIMAAQGAVFWVALIPLIIGGILANSGCK